MMQRIIAWFVVSIAFCHLSSAVAQQPPDFGHRIVIETDTAQPVREAPWVSYLSHHAIGLEALRDPVLRHELFDRDKRDQVEALLDRHGNAMRRIDRISEWRSLDEESRRIVAERISMLNVASEVELASMLNEAEVHRLRQLIHWQSVAQWGLHRLLIGSSIADRLDLRQDQIDDLKNQCEVLAIQLESETRSLEIEVMELIIDSFDDEQRRQLEPLLRTGDDEIPYPINSADSIWMSLRAPDAPNDGEMATEDAATPNDAQTWRDRHLPILNQRLAYSGDKRDLIRIYGESWLELSAPQRLEIDQVARDLERHMVRLREDFPDWNDRNSPERDVYITAWREAADRALDQIETSVLESEQQKRLQDLHLVALTRCHGFVPLILEGSLGESLQLSREQEESVKRNAVEAERLALNKIEAMHESVRNQAMESLTPSQRERLTDALGEPPSLDIQGTVDQLIRNLRYRKWNGETR